MTPTGPDHATPPELRGLPRSNYARSHAPLEEPMSDKTAIEWTDSTWNPIRMHWGVSGKVAGHYCLKLSPGCDHCYAAKLQYRYYGGQEYAPVSTDGLAEAQQWVANGALYLDPRARDQPLKWARPRRIFVCSMTDLFGEWVPDAWISDVWTIMLNAPQHTFQVLTKRPNRMRDWLARTPAFGAFADRWGYGGIDPLPNVWLGVTIESDAYTWRAKVLAECPAAVRFVSAEPLLSALPSLSLDRIDWLIAGGESGGPSSRRLVEHCCCLGTPFPPDYPIGGHRTRSCAPYESGNCDLSNWRPTTQAVEWVRDLRDRAAASGTAFLLKQWGGPTPKAGGRRLDGRTWDEYPESRVAVPA